MKKIRLDVEELEVISFGTEAAPSPRGTVEARSRTVLGDTQCDYSRDHNQSCRDECIVFSWEYPNCDQSGDTCGASCDWACDSVNIC